MRNPKVPSLVLALALQVLPITRVFIAAAPATGCSFAIVSTWIAGAVALLGSYDVVSGASTTITSPGTAIATNGTPFYYRITTGPEAANTFDAAPLPSGLTVSRTVGRITGTPTVDGVFTILLTASDSGKPSRTVTKDLVLTILPAGGGNTPPSITTQPASRFVTNGGTATFAVVATGSAPLRYRWRNEGTPMAGATNSTLTITAVAPAHAGNYEVVITNNYGSVTSVAAVLTVLVPPSITTQPIGQTVTSGDDATFSVVAAGTAPLSYQWRRNGINVAGGTSSTLNLSAVTTGQAGTYTVVMGNAAGSITSAVATLTVNTPPVPDATRPTVTILSPKAAFTRVTSNTVALMGTASDNQGLARVEVQQGTNEFVPATGMNNWVATFLLAPGTNVFRVRATDASGNHSLTNTRTVFFAAVAPLSLTVNGSGMVSPVTNQQILELGKTYTLKAKPMPGNLFSNWIVAGHAVAGPVFTFTMSSNLAVVASFVANTYLGLKCAYSGLFHPETSEPPHEQSGHFTLTVTDRGTYSGKLLLNGSAFSISGAFGLDLSDQKIVLRRGTNELFVGLQLVSGSDRITGYVSNAFWSSELFGYRAAFHSVTNPATNFLGKYTMLLAGRDDAANTPFGLGFISFDVAKSGSVTLKGSLADGTAGAQRGSLAANGQLAVYLNLFRGRGSLFGWLTFTDTATNDIPGLLLWTRKDGLLGGFHPEGFTNEVRALASRYTPPAKGVSTLGVSNCVVVLEGGNLAGPATNELFLSALNKITVISTNTNKLALTVSTSSGLLNGSFVHPRTLKKSPVKGVVLQKQNLGGGFFLGTNESGSAFFGLPEAMPSVFNP
jgi:hypothetical protein